MRLEDRIASAYARLRAEMAERHPEWPPERLDKFAEVGANFVCWHHRHPWRYRLTVLLPVYVERVFCYAILPFALGMVAVYLCIRLGILPEVRQ